MNEKLQQWLNEGPCCYWSLHMFERGLILKALSFFASNYELNPIARQVYEHLIETDSTSELPVVFPSPETLKQYMREGDHEKIIETSRSEENLWDEEEEDV